ncbi:inositol monophosphatase family protein [Gulosibacter chungangensis]|uniref:inositol monophosphatase family protein n=1 Tax=Gulosibacter chungangensis TaxID=979746 RepID=UPI001CE479F7|nr:inositol monophosphatase family protein [Gulosibacter chungangensis]
MTGNEFAASVDRHELLEITTSVATEAAELVSHRRREGVQVAATKSSLVDVVTAADIEAEHFIREELAKLRPEDGFFGEESDASPSRSGITWVVDPIDGTVNYLYGSPNYAVSIAAVVGDPSARPTAFEALAGAVVAPDLGKTYAAVKDGGAFVNGQRIQLGEGPSSLAQTLVASGFSYSPERRVLQAQAWLGMADKVRDLRRVGAASLDLCAVAEGQVDVYYEIGLKPWDWAAGVLVARESGARVGGKHLSEREGQSILTAGHPGVIAPFIDLLLEVAPPKLLASGKNTKS